MLPKIVIVWVHSDVTALAHPWLPCGVPCGILAHRPDRSRRCAASFPVTEQLHVPDVQRIALEGVVCFPKTLLLLIVLP